MMRDKNTWEIYKWASVPPSEADVSDPVNDTTATSSGGTSTSSGTAACVGELCCTDGLMYDSAKNQCVTATTTTEGFGPFGNS